MSLDSFQTKQQLTAGNTAYQFFRLKTLADKKIGAVQQLPFSLKILLENLLRYEDGVTVTKEDIETLAHWDVKNPKEKEISFMPSRVLLQDFTGVPCLVDLASMRDAIVAWGGDPNLVNPLQQVDLVIDHSVQVDVFGVQEAFEVNSRIEYERNRERYSFLRWGQKAFRNFRVVPPGTGIVHQVNLEYLGQVVSTAKKNMEEWLYPDTVIGTDSHTTMINGLGVLGWGVGGIEAEGAMLGQPVSMLIPDVVGFKFTGKLPPGTSATDLVLTATQMLRKKGVVGKFVEFYGPGLSHLSLPDRATLANMAPEYGATMGFFPVDEQTLRYLSLTGRPEDLIERVRVYSMKQGLFRKDETPDPIFSDTIELDLGSVRPSVAGPRRPQDRVALEDAKKSFTEALPSLLKKGSIAKNPDPTVLSDGSTVIAAITSCTNTSNPSVLIEAGLLAKKAVEMGLKRKPWVKTSLAPGSKVVTDYLQKAGLLKPLEDLGFFLVGYGCTTCIGNSGPLPIEVEQTIKANDLVVASVLSGNRNFEGRIHAHVRANYLMSPALVVAYALAGNISVDLTKDSLGVSKDGKPVFLKDLWPGPEEIAQAVAKHVTSDLFRKEYATVFEGDKYWKAVSVPPGNRFLWEGNSTYIRRGFFLEEISRQPHEVKDLERARVLALLGDSVTTDHISPAGSIQEASPAGQYLLKNGVSKLDFNSYGARRGNREVMVRGTFANSRLKNGLVPGIEGGFTKKFPEGKEMTIYEASMAYQVEKTPLVILAGKEYGSGSSRDWAAKGVKMLGVKAVIAESFERIHRSNLVMMGVLPLQFEEGKSAASLGLSGEETFNIKELEVGIKPKAKLRVTADKNGQTIEFSVLLRIDTPKEVEYYKHGGILPYVMRQLIK